MERPSMHDPSFQGEEPESLPITFEYGEGNDDNQERRLGMETDQLTYNSSETD